MLTGTTVTPSDLVAMRHNSPWTTRSAIRPGSARAFNPTGQGTEFRELRDYAPGDDPRHIDWRATGRTGLPLTRVLDTQRDTTWLHIIALTPGMYFGSRVAYKSVRVLELAAQSGWQCIDSGDRVAALVASPHGQEVQPPTGQAHRFASYLARWAAHSALPPSSTPVNFATLLRNAQQAVRGAQVVVLWGDFLPGPDWETLLDALSRKSGVLVQVADPLEQRIPHSGDYRAYGDSGLVHLAGSPQTARHYAESRHRWLTRLLRPPHRAHFDWYQCSTAKPGLAPVEADTQ